MDFSTGLPELDDALGGGIRKKTITLIYGEEKTGKTSLVLRMCALATRTSSAAYVDCSGRLHPLRLDQIMKANGGDGSKLYLLSINSFYEQEKAILSIHDFTAPAPLIAFDDFTALHRLELTGEIKLDMRIYKTLAFQLAALKEVAMKRDLAIIVVGQVHEIPDRGEARAVAQRILSYWADQVLRLEKHPTHKAGRILIEKPRIEKPILYKISRSGLVPV